MRTQNNERQHFKLPHRPFSPSNPCAVRVDIMPIAALNKLIGILKDIVSQRFWGTFEIRFEDGLIVNVKKTENIKL